MCACRSYTNGPQNGSRVSHNWVYRQEEQSMGAYYPDDGSRGIEISENVASALNNGRPAGQHNSAWWLFLWKNTIRDCPVFENFAENGTGCWNAGSNCRMWNNTLFEPGAPPPQAQAIMAASGTHGNYWNARGESRGYVDSLRQHPYHRHDEGASLNAEAPHVTGFGCSALGGPPPPHPTFNPPFQNCHC